MGWHRLCKTEVIVSTTSTHPHHFYQECCILYYWHFSLLLYIKLYFSQQPAMSQLVANLVQRMCVLFCVLVCFAMENMCGIPCRGVDVVSMARHFYMLMSGLWLQSVLQAYKPFVSGVKYQFMWKAWFTHMQPCTWKCTCTKERKKITKGRKWRENKHTDMMETMVGLSRYQIFTVWLLYT